MIGLDSYSRQVFIYLDPILIYISLWIDCLFEIRPIAVFPLAFIAGWLQGHWWGFISRNYVVWPTFLLMNVFIALKGSHFWFYWNIFPRPFEKILNLFLSVYKECFQKLQRLTLVLSYNEKHMVRAHYFSKWLVLFFYFQIKRLWKMPEEEKLEKVWESEGCTWPTRGFGGVSHRQNPATVQVLSPASVQALSPVSMQTHTPASVQIQSPASERAGKYE